MDAIYIVALLLTAALSFAAVFTCTFKDNTMQRIGLSMVGFGSCIELWLTFNDLDCCRMQNARDILVIGIATYGIGTLVKVLKHRRNDEF